MPTSRRMRVRKRSSIGAVRSPASEAAILDAAARILRTEGFDGFTIESVAKQARASKPTIYKWWGTKARLIGEVYAKQVPVHHTPLDSGSVERDLEVHFERLWEVWSDPKWATASRRLLEEAQSGPDALEFYRDDYLKSRNQPLVEILSRGIARGELPASIDVDLVVEIVSSFNLFRLIMGQPVDSRTSRALVQLLMSGLLASRPVK